MLCFNCPNCNEYYEVDDSLSGKKVRCENCETVFYIAVGILLLVLLIKLIKGMIKELKQSQSKPKQFAWKDEIVRLRKLDTDDDNKRRRKPRDPRAA